VDVGGDGRLEVVLVFESCLDRSQNSEKRYLVVLEHREQVTPKSSNLVFKAPSALNSAQLARNKVLKG
jgi:hypothetical protein